MTGRVRMPALRALCAMTLTLLGLNGYGQCDPPDLLPSADCFGAPLICLQDACYSTQSEPPPDPINGFCGPNTALHNPQYILFQVTQLPVTIAIEVVDCGGGGCGLQSAIINIPLDSCDTWDPGDVVECDPGTGEGGTMTLSTSALQIDSFYLLMIDGCAGQICEWAITQADGVFEPQLPTDDQLTWGGPDDYFACPGQDSWTAMVGDPIPEVAGYLWGGFPWGDITTTDPELDISIPPDAQPGVYEICVFAYTGCDQTELSYCFEMEILPVPEGESPPDTLCEEEFDAGVLWGSTVINGPGIYLQQFADPDGCISDSTKEYFQHPVPDEGLLDTLVCNTPPLIYEGNQYDQAGTYELLYPMGSIYGCDSMATLNVNFAYIEGEIVINCDAGDWILSVETYNQYPQNLDPLYTWRDNSGMIISDEEEVIVTEPGTYSVELVMEIDGQQCVFPVPDFTFSLTDIMPGPPVFIQNEGSICNTQVAQYIVENFAPEVIEYIWTLPGDAIILSGQGTTILEVDWQASSGGEVCVAMVNECGEGPQECFDVEVIPEPLPFFDAPVIACVDEVFLVEFSGTASGNAEFFWDFGGGTIVSGGTGPGPHEISYSSTGSKVITLQVLDPGCDTVSMTHEVVVEFLGTPVVNCESTTSSVTFTWSSVPGATGYNVTVITSQSGSMPNDTTFVVTGLANSETVTVQVSAQGGGACPDQTVEVSCNAEDCTAPAFSINSISPQCENDNNQILELIVGGSPATGVWSGPGIIDANTGEFSPMTAGAGVHQVSVMYDDGMCTFNWPISITVNQQPAATFTATPLICASETATITYTGLADPGASYTWDFAGGTVVSGSGQGPYEIRWTQGGTYTVTLVVEENGCTSTQESHMVQVDPLLGVPSIQCASTTSSITFSWADVDNAADYAVNVLSGETGTLGVNEYSVTGLTPGDSTVLEVIALSAGACPSTADTLVCYAQDCPSPSITLIPSDTTLCLYPGTGVIQMEAVVVGGTGTGTWSGTGITDTDLGTFDPNIAGNGSHVVTYTYIDQGCMFSRDATIEVNDPPLADIASGNFIITCTEPTLVLDGSASTATNGLPIYAWSTSDGVIASRADSSHAVVAAAGTYKLVVSDPVSGCLDSTSVVVALDDGVPVADAGDDMILDCEVMNATLGGSSTGGPTIEYLWTTQDGAIDSDPTLASIDVSTPGTYELMVSDIANGCVSVDEAVVTQNLDVPSITVSADGILTCDNGMVTVSSDLIGGSGDFTYMWSTANGTIQSDPTAASIEVISPGMYQLNVIDNLSKCEDSTDVEVLADDDVIASLDVAVVVPRCAGDANGAISIDQVLGGSAPFMYSWSNGSTDPAITGLGAGTYSVVVTDNNGCSFEQSWVLPDPQLVTAELGENIEANIGDTVVVTLETSIAGGALDSTVWGGLAGPCSPCLVVSFIAEQSGVVEVTVVDTSGCTASDAISVTVQQPKGFYAPNAFSPNDDGVNDWFLIDGPSIAEVSKLTIFDRWGNLLHESENLIPGEPAWDGSFKGEVLNPGVYVYHARIVHDDGFEEEKIGDVTIIR